MSKSRLAVLINLGSPDDPSPQKVGRYLREFLSDPLVIDKPAWFRWLLVNLIIVPLRRHRSSHAYKKIWTDRGSPLKTYNSDLAKLVQNEVGADWQVVSAMRYGEPSLEKLLVALKDQQWQEVLFIPLYPQNAKSSNGTVIELIRKHSQQIRAKCTIVEPFYSEPLFIEAYAQVIRKNLKGHLPEHLLFSFHGLPERHVKETDPRPDGCLSSESCCAEITNHNRNCYRAQSYATARSLARTLGLRQGEWSVSFQSRLGREPWIKPFTDQVLEKMGQSGAKEVYVSCPSFVADCLETIEEIGMNAKEQMAGYGTKLELLPALNTDPQWVKALADVIRGGLWARRSP